MPRRQTVEDQVKTLLWLAQVGAALSEARKVITAAAMASGKKRAAQGKLKSGIMDEDDKDADGESTSKSMYIPISKVDKELREVTGVVLQPEVVDGQYDIMSAEVIAKAAGNFLSKYNKGTVLGYQHKEFNKRFELRQSFLAPDNMVIANKTIKKGSWLMVVKVLDNKVWEAVKEGTITGFSIGGKAKVKKLTE